MNKKGESMKKTLFAIITTLTFPVTASAENLIVYFSTTGNTQKVAETIQNISGGDIYRIEPVVAYPDDYTSKTQIAKQEQADNARPKYKEMDIDMSKYDTVFVGYPIWWGIMPMIVYSFFDDYDMSGKIIMPFTTSGGSGAGDTQSRIQELEPNAKVFDVLHFYASEMANDQTESVKAWIDKNK